MRDYVRYYNDDRPHMALDSDAPAGRAVEGPELGEVDALPRVDGLTICMRGRPDFARK